MHMQEILVLAVTRMAGGVCLAGMATESHPVTCLQWVRPVREHSHVLLGDITSMQGQVLRPFDVAEFALQCPRPEPPHVEDWTADFARHRPRVLRVLQGERRTGFLQRHLDRAPAEVIEDQQRSLCLVKPQELTGRFTFDAFTGKLDARIAFTLGGKTYAGHHGGSGLPVTDLRWRALGRTWLGNEGGAAAFDSVDLAQRLGVQEVYLTIGLSRRYDGRCWPMVVGVHAVPDLPIVADYGDI